jgi:hypothetical protein
MQPQVIIVHDIQKSIEDVGITPYANTLVQDMGGAYWYVEVKGYFDDYPKKDDLGDGCRICVEKYIDYADDPEGEEVTSYCLYRIVEVPLRLAYFVIDALRLKAQALLLGSTSRSPESQSVYILPGTKIFGHTVDKLTEIPAELRPVVVKRL